MDFSQKPITTLLLCLALYPFTTLAPAAMKLQPRFGLTIEGLYLRQSNNDWEYAYIDRPSNLQVLTTKPSYYGAFRIGAEVALPDAATNAQFSWLHFNQNYTSTISEGGGGVVPIYGPSTEFYPDFDSGSGKINTKFDALDLNLGQVVAIKEYMQVRLYAGVRYAQLQNDFTTQVNNSTATGTDTAITESVNNSSYYGIGPLVGISGSYELAKYVSLVANMDAALLVGNVNANATLTNITATGVTDSSLSIPTSTTTRTLPAFDGKVGLRFGRNFNNNKSQINIEGGYQINYYFNMIDRFHVNGASDSSIFATSAPRYSSYFSLNGAYLSLNYNFL